MPTNATASPRSLPPDYIPEPRVVLLGCRPWPPPRNADGTCGVCGGGIDPAHSTYHCAACGASAPAIDARCRAARIGLQARTATEAAEKGAADKLRRVNVVLTESERRRVWNGHRGGIVTSNPEPTNRAAIGRAWLVSIGQTPDWTLILDRRGNVVGHYEDVA